MNFSKIRFEGIYNLETFAFLNQKGLRNFLFDFSPRSMNFIPLHHFIKLMRSEYSVKHTYYLLFENEKEYVIGKVLDDLRELIGPKNFGDNIYLEIDEFTLKEIESMKQKFYLRYTEGMNFSLLSRCNLDFCEGLVINEGDLMTSDRDDLFEIIGRVSLEWNKSSSKRCQIIVNNFSDSTTALVMDNHVDYISLVLSEQYECEYRKIDFKVINSKLKSLELLRKQLESIKK